MKDCRGPFKSHCMRYYSMLHGVITYLFPFLGLRSVANSVEIRVLLVEALCVKLFVELFSGGFIDFVVALVATFVSTNFLWRYFDASSTGVPLSRMTKLPSLVSFPV